PGLRGGDESRNHGRRADAHRVPAPDAVGDDEGSGARRLWPRAEHLALRSDEWEAFVTEMQCRRRSALRPEGACIRSSGRRSVPTERKLDVASIQRLVIAGWTGRDAAAVEAHIRELEAIGVKRPKTVPIFYRVARSLLTTAPSIEVMADKSSGEVEFVLFALDDGLWVGLGSDHTDRKAETIGVTLSKQLCAKPVGPALWRYDEIKSHWDKLVLRAFVQDGDKRRLYQEGPVTNMRSPEELIRLYTGGSSLTPGTAMFCGTFAVHGDISYSGTFDMELDDPELGRKLRHGYNIVSLPD